VRYGSSRPRNLREASTQAADQHRPTRGGRTGCRRLRRRQRLPLLNELRVHVPSTPPVRHRVRGRHRTTAVAARERVATAARVWTGVAIAAAAWRRRGRCNTGCRRASEGGNGLCERGQGWDGSGGGGVGAATTAAAAWVGAATAAQHVWVRPLPRRREMRSFRDILFSGSNWAKGQTTS
jgi:hypothetical protein